MKIPVDLERFWQEHDRSLPQHGSPGEATLSHDLYRGMPTWFNAYYAHFQRRALLSLLRKIELQTGSRGLDLGCGTGRWSGLMLERGLHPYGVDLGEQALRYAARRWRGADFVCGRLPHLCYSPNSFDLAISVTALQHLPRSAQPVALQNVWRAMKPGGFVLVCETTGQGDPSPHVFGNSCERWIELFSSTGFQLVAQAGCEYLPYVQLFQRLRRSWQRSGRGKRSAADVSAIARLLDQQPLLGLPVWVLIHLSYPLEYLAGAILPQRLAKMGCFCLRKP